jgi:hypothetical protein
MAAALVTDIQSQRESALKKAEARVAHLEDANRALMDAANTASDMIDKLEAERDAAIRELDESDAKVALLEDKLKHATDRLEVLDVESDERDKLRASVAELEGEITANSLTPKEVLGKWWETIRRAKSAEARVADLESQLESVADRAAAAETALEAAPTASGGVEEEPLAESNSHIADGFLSEIGCTVRDCIGCGCLVAGGPTRCKRCSALCDAASAPAASGGGDGEPVAWMYKGEPWFDGNRWHDKHELTTDERLAKWKDKDAFPLYAAPPQPRGWLTPEDQDAILFLIGSRSHFSPQTPHEARRNAACRVCHSLIDSSSPPEVVRPAVNRAGARTYVEIVQSRDGQWLSALAAAGVPVKEVGRE